MNSVRFWISITLCFAVFAVFAQSKGQKLTRADYISTFSKMAVSEQKRSGVPASITLSQGILESGDGNSYLAREGNNHFGIKCHKDWKGERIYADDDELNECFRKYKSVEESYRDHSDFLLRNSRYAPLFELNTKDYKGWAKGLKKAGYATNPKYADLLISLIEENNLHQFDEGKGRSKPDKPEKNKNERGNRKNNRNNVHLADVDNYEINPFGRKIFRYNNIKYIEVKEGDSFLSIATEFEMMLWEVYKYNDLGKGNLLKPGQRIYIQPKKAKAERGNETYTVQEEDNLHSISQKFGIKMKKLYRYNNIKPGDAVSAGTELWLRKRKPPVK